MQPRGTSGHAAGAGAGAGTTRQPGHVEPVVGRGVNALCVEHAGLWHCAIRLFRLKHFLKKQFLSAAALLILLSRYIPCHSEVVAFKDRNLRVALGSPGPRASSVPNLPEAER